MLPPGPEWFATSIPGDDLIFEPQLGCEAPLPNALGVPLVFPPPPCPALSTTLGPQAWQSKLGNVLVARLDRGPLLEQHLEGIWMYRDRVLYLFGEGGGAPKHLFNRPAFEKWWARCAKETRQLRDDWNIVPTPYEV